MNNWNEEPLVFDCEGDRLVGILHRTATPNARLGVLVVVGGPQYRVGSHRQFVLMARALAVAGYAVLRFDYRGMGDSEGAGRTFEDVEADLQAATAAFQRAVPELAGIVLWGLCDAASAIMMSMSPTVVKGRILVNPWARTESGEAKAYVRHYYLRRIMQRDFWRKIGTGALDTRRALGQFLESLSKSVLASDKTEPINHSYIARMLEGAMRFKGPTLLILSGRDLTAREFKTHCSASVDWSRVIASPEVRLNMLENADHTFSDPGALRTLNQLCCDWLDDSVGLRA